MFWRLKENLHGIDGIIGGSVLMEITSKRKLTRRTRKL
jgi:hypothetical protein